MIKIFIVDYLVEFRHVYDMAWGGARDTLDKIESQGREAEFMSLLDEHFSEDLYPNGVEDAVINHFIWIEVAAIMNLYAEDEDEEE